MRRLRRLLAPLVLVTAVGFALAACATPIPGDSAGPAQDAPPGQSLGSLSPAPPAGEVAGQGTVRDADGDVQLCLGAIMESYPPQCRGIPITNWTWDGVDGSEESGGVRWGAYALQGTFDGASFTVTQPPIMLALYDPIAVPEEPQEPGVTDEQTLLAIQEELPDRLGDDLLSSMVRNGYLVVTVVWDDGTWQAAADDDFGAGVVSLRSALREVG